MINMLMQPQSADTPPRMKFLVRELQYMPGTLYRILAKTFCPIKGYESDAEEVVGCMKNLIFNLCMSQPINIPDFFFRTMIDAAQSPHTLKPYAPWIMKLIRAKTGFHYLENQHNHCLHLPPVEVLPSTIASVDTSDKGKGIFYES